jgi:beta-exotoxin I transport system ATP-binding protein
VNAELPIEISHLTKTYGAERGIVDVSLEVARGEVFGFLGPNGAGKTTAIRILLDHLRATSGSARLFGLDSRDVLKVHRELGFVSSEPAFYDALTVQQMLDWLSRLRGRDDQIAVVELSQRLDLDLSRSIAELSRGNRQKVSIVQAFMHNPSLVIMDEPTSGLDPLIQHAFEALVAGYVDNGGTVFLSSHILSEVEELCDRVAIIREGELVALKTMTELRAAAIRTMTVELASVPESDFLDDLSGVEVVERDGRKVVVTIAGAGGVGEVLSALGEVEVVDLVSMPPDLEEVFLSYYATGGHG